MRRSGFTLVEMAIVIVLIGILTGLTFPKIRDALDKTSVRSARVDVATFVALARNAAVRRGCQGVVHFVYGTQSRVWVTACPRYLPGTGTVDTIASIDNLENRYSVSLTSTSDSVQFDPRGLRIVFATTVVRFTGNVNSNTDSLVINQIGKVVR
jgi:prepilin-type N-terminal cleavage/methylation domain-containing protein